MSTKLVREYASQILRTPKLSVKESMAVEGLGRGDTLQEIGDHAGVSREWVRRLAQSALWKFRAWADRTGAHVLEEMDTPPEIPHKVGRQAWPLRLCSVEGCENRHCQHGLCKKHFYRKLYAENGQRREQTRRLQRERQRRIKAAVSDEEYATLTYTIGKEKWPNEGRKRDLA